MLRLEKFSLWTLIFSHAPGRSLWNGGLCLISDTTLYWCEQTGRLISTDSIWYKQTIDFLDSITLSATFIAFCWNLYSGRIYKNVIVTFFFFLMYLKSGSRYFCFNSHFVGWIVTVDASRLQTKLDLLFIYLLIFIHRREAHTSGCALHKKNEWCLFFYKEWMMSASLFWLLTLQVWIRKLVRIAPPGIDSCYIHVADPKVLIYLATCSFRDYLLGSGFQRVGHEFVGEDMLEPREADVPVLFLVLVVLPLVAYVLLGKWSETAKKRERISLLSQLAAEEALRVEAVPSVSVSPLVPTSINEFHASTSKNEFNVPALKNEFPASTSKSGFQLCARCFAPATTRCSRCKSVRYWYISVLFLL